MNLSIKFPPLKKQFPLNLPNGISVSQSKITMLTFLMSNTRVIQEINKTLSKTSGDFNEEEIQLMTMTCEKLQRKYEILQMKKNEEEESENDSTQSLDNSNPNQETEREEESEDKRLNENELDFLLQGLEISINGKTLSEADERQSFSELISATSISSKNPSSPLKLIANISFNPRRAFTSISQNSYAITTAAATTNSSIMTDFYIEGGNSSFYNFNARSSYDNNVNIINNNGSFFRTSQQQGSGNNSPAASNFLSGITTPPPQLSAFFTCSKHGRECTHYCTKCKKRICAFDLVPMKSPKGNVNQFQQQNSTASIILPSETSKQPVEQHPAFFSRVIALDSPSNSNSSSPTHSSSSPQNKLNNSTHSASSPKLNILHTESQSSFFGNSFYLESICCAQHLDEVITIEEYAIQLESDLLEQKKIAEESATKIESVNGAFTREMGFMAERKTKNEECAKNLKEIAQKIESILENKSQTTGNEDLNSPVDQEITTFNNFRQPPPPISSNAFHSRIEEMYNLDEFIIKFMKTMEVEGMLDEDRILETEQYRGEIENLQNQLKEEKVKSNFEIFQVRKDFEKLVREREELKAGLEKQNSDFSLKLASKDQEIKKLIKEIAQKKQEFEEIHEKNSSTIKEQQKLIEEREKAIEIQTNSISFMSGDLETKTSNIKDMEERIINLTSQNKQFSETMSENEIKISQLDNENSSLKHEIEKISKETKEEIEEILNKNQMEIENLNKTNQKELENLEISKQEAIQSLTISKQEAIDTLMESKQEEIDNLTKTKQEEIETLSKSKEAAIEELEKSKQIAIENLEKSKQTAIEDLEKSKQAAIENLEKSKQDAIVKLIKEQLQELETLKLQKQNEIETVTRQKSEIIENLAKRREHDLENLSKKRQDDIDNLTKLYSEQISNLQSKIQANETILAQNHASIQEKDQLIAENTLKIEEMSKEMDSLSKETEANKKKTQFLSEELGNMNTENRKNKEKLKKSMNKAKELETTIASKDQDIKKQIDLQNELKSKIEKLKLELENENKIRKENDDIIVILKGKNKEIEMKFATLERTANKMNEDLMKTKMELQNVSKECEDYKTILENKQIEFGRKTLDLEKKNVVLEQKIKAVNMIIEEKVEENLTLSAELQSLHEKPLNVRHQNTIFEQKQKIEGLQKEIQDFELAKSDYNKTINDLKAEIQKEMKISAEKQKEIGNYDQIINDLNEKIENYLKLQQELDIVSTKNVDIQRLLEERADENNKFVAEREERERIFIMMGAELEREKKESNKKRIEIEGLQSVLSEKLNQLETQNKEIEMLKSQNRANLEKIEENELEIKKVEALAKENIDFHTKVKELNTMSDKTNKSMKEVKEMSDKVRDKEKNLKEKEDLLNYFEKKAKKIAETLRKAQMPVLDGQEICIPIIPYRKYRIALLLVGKFTKKSGDELSGHFKKLNRFESSIEIKQTLYIDSENAQNLQTMKEFMQGMDCKPIDCYFVASNGPFPLWLGDFLNNELEKGKGVVVARQCTSNLNFGICGKIETEMPFEKGNGKMKDGKFGIDETSLSGFSSPSSPSQHQTPAISATPHSLLNSVKNFSGGKTSQRDSIRVRLAKPNLEKIDLVACWNDNTLTPMIIYKRYFGEKANFGNIVVLNFWPFALGSEDGWDYKTDGDKILQNAIIWGSTNAWEKDRKTMIANLNEILFS